MRISIVVLALLVVSCVGISPMTVITTAPTYVTGVATLISSPSNKVNNAGNTLPVTFATAAPTTSLNASAGLKSCEFDMKGTTFGWKITIDSLTATGMMVSFSTTDPTNYIRLLAISYIANWGAPFNLNYIAFTLSNSCGIETQRPTLSPTTLWLPLKHAHKYQGIAGPSCSAASVILPWGR